jgi:bacillithiol biosynthesis cysteine-adding enzyme BshC
MGESHQQIGYESLSYYKPLFLDYLSHEPKLKRFFAAHPDDPHAWEEVAGRVSQRPRDTYRLASTLQRQNERLGADREALDSIDAIGRGALAVVTGQQVGFFGGPLYTLYKALTAVQLARHLSERLARPVAPLFWMDTDDHDFEEVRKLNLLDSSFSLVELAYDLQAHPGQVPVNHHRLEASVASLIERLHEVLAETEYKRAVLGELARCYAPGQSLADAFGCWLLRLTRGLGLAVVNPGDPELKRMGARLFETEVRRGSQSGSEVRRTSDELLALGYHAQAAASSDAINLFYASPGRYHIEGHHGGLRIQPDGPLLALEELAGRVGSEPERFSPNVLLRPLYQDTLLPTIAYVAGPSELAYFAQLGDVYRSFDVPMPIVFPRASFTVVERTHARWLARHGIPVADLQVDDESALNRILRGEAPPQLEEDFTRARACLQELLQALERDLTAVDPTLAATVRSTRGKLLHLIQGLESRGLRAMKRKNDTLRKKFFAARTSLFPRFQLQERELPAVQFLVKYGWGFVEVMRRSIDLSTRKHVVVYP